MPSRDVDLDEIAARIEARLSVRLTAIERQVEVLPSIEKRMETERIDSVVYRSGVQSNIADLTDKISQYGSKLSIIQEVQEDWRERQATKAVLGRILSGVRWLLVAGASAVGIAAYFGLHK